MADSVASGPRREWAADYLENQCHAQSHPRPPCFVPAVAECAGPGLARVIPSPNFARAQRLAPGRFSLETQKKGRGTNNKPHTLRASVVAEKDQSFVPA